MEAREQPGSGDPCRCAGWTIKDIACVAKPDTGHAWGYNKGQKSSSVLRLADIRECVEQAR